MSVQVLKARLGALVSNPPIFTIARILARLGIESNFVTCREVVRFINTGDPARLESIFRRICRDAPQCGIEPDRDLTDKNILEIGCGRNGGLAPFMMRQNAKQYTGVDPLVHRDVLHSGAVLRALEQGYFKTRGIDETALRKRFASHCHFLKSPDDRELDPLDIITSISCLEHIDDLESVIKSISEKLAPGGCHLHLVNFSNHLDRDQPFRWMYELSPDAFKRSHGGIINLKRPSDVKGIFEKLGFKTTLVPLDIRPEAIPTDTLHPWWRDNYDIEELAVRTAVLHAVKTP